MISRSVRFLVALGKAGQSLRLRLHSGLRQSGIPPIAQRAARWMGHPARWMGHPAVGGGVEACFSGFFLHGLGGFGEGDVDADLGLLALEDADEVADFGIILILPQLPILED